MNTADPHLGDDRDDEHGGDRERAGPDDAFDDVSVLLEALGAGEVSAAERLLPLLYEELRAVAGKQLRRERPGHTLQATALVHEAFLKLVRQDRATWRDEAHFLAVAAMAMRRILVNHARDRNRLKRGGGNERVALQETAIAFDDPGVDLIAIDDALVRLGELDAAQARIVELRFFAGLSMEQIAEVCGCSVRTVHRDWSMARAWLRGELLGDRA